jgi:hypothetical protein
MLLPAPAEIESYSVCEYQHLDDLRFIHRPETVFEDENPADVRLAVNAIRDRFLAAGWEGDGEIGIIWFPPFLDFALGDTWGDYIWHVKQLNNGTSFLAGPINLRQFKRVDEQNDYDFCRNAVLVSFVHDEVETLKKKIESISNQLVQKLTCIDALTKTELRLAVVSDQLAHSQGLIVRTFNEFLDDCYLEYLKEVVNRGNCRKLKLRKSKVSVDPDGFDWSDELGEFDEDGNQWFNLQTLIKIMWDAFKFEPFKVKLEVVFGAVGYKLAETIRSELIKHVVLRNCIQHHAGRLDAVLLRQCGSQQIVIRRDPSPLIIEAWKPIEFTKEELTAVGQLIIEMATEFEEFVGTKFKKDWRRYSTVPSSESKLPDTE